MSDNIPIDSDAIADIDTEGTVHEVTSDIASQRLGIVNVVYFGVPGGGAGQPWVLIDTGIPGTQRLIERAARERFGDDTRPAAIVMTHGHFDHVGSLESLASE